MRRPDGNDSMGGKGRDAVAGSAFQAWRSWPLTSAILAISANVGFGERVQHRLEAVFDRQPLAVPVPHTPGRGMD
jgi:hypothetical protein